MVNTDVLNNQLQTGQTDMPSIIGAVKDSGAIDVSFEEGEDNDDSRKDGRCQDDEFKNTKSHRGTQTGLFSFSIK